ncbi:MAG: histidinol dehydrogenase [Candidatus Micrarchaeota archaeon]
MLFIVAVPSKGSLSSPSRRLLSAAGFDSVEESRTYALNGSDVSFLFVRARDVPQYLERGIADVGITGKDLLVEAGNTLPVLMELPFGKCRVSLAAPKDAPGEFLTIATSYPNLTRQLGGQNSLVNLLELDGAVEASVTSGAADAIVDVVSTGATLKANGLVEKKVLLESNAVLTASNMTLETKRAQLDAFVGKLECNIAIFRKPMTSLDQADRRKLFDRGRERSSDVISVVREIVFKVALERDSAVSFYARKFDGAELAPKEFLVTRKEILDAYSMVPPKLVSAMQESAANIKGFAKKELPQRFEIKRQGGFAGKAIIPLDSVGVYAPGGTAAYPSSVLMGVVPAKVAGVGKVVVCTPCGVSKKCNPAVLVAADIAGADEVYRIGGAQAIAAMAYGTSSIPRVRKIVGPGNAYVAAAKMEVQARGLCAIDLPAGPSEVLVVADESANPKWVAADLLAQAEHDVDSCPVLVTSSAGLADQVEQELRSQVVMLPRRRIAEKALESNGAILLVRDVEEAIAFANTYAPEHLELCVERPGAWLRKVRNAGAVFLGNYSCEAAGDYSAGPNHVLPTGGAARAYSGLSASAFVREMNYLMLQRDGLESLKDGIVAIADAEGLEAHALSVKKRFEVM